MAEIKRGEVYFGTESQRVQSKGGRLQGRNGKAEQYGGRMVPSAWCPGSRERWIKRKGEGGERERKTETERHTQTQDREARCV